MVLAGGWRTVNLPWSAIAHVVRGAAPMIATALGGPVAGRLTGLAVQLLTGALDLPANTPPEAVAQAVQAATPDQVDRVAEAEATFRLRAAELAAQAFAGQVEVDKVEAASGSLFVAGWRPALGWILDAGLAWGLVVQPVVFGLVRLLHPDVVAPVLDLSVIVPLVVGMLGLGSFRTIEKLRGVQTRRIGAAPAVQPVPVPPVVVQQPAAPPAAVVAAAMPMPEPIAPVVVPPAPPAPAPRKAFFDTIRASLFGGHLVQSQVEGINRILDHWERTYPGGDPRHLAYDLATAWWETGHAMQPVEEVGRGAAHPYGATGFYGRGLVQLTHQENYARMSPLVGIDLVAHPDAALTWPVALVALFEGTRLGLFTGHKLADFFTAEKSDPVGARAVVNGSDHASEIAAACAIFLACLPRHAS